jgi:chemotaxis protein CheX
MPIGEQVELQASDLAQIVQSVFETMLAMEISESGTRWFAGSDRLTALVHLSGAWSGALLLECSRGQACCFASRFLSLDALKSVDDIVRAALGELANIIGGNLKCVMTPGIHLSMPSVVDGSDYSVLVCGAELRERLAFDSPEGVFWVTVVSATQASNSRD